MADNALNDIVITSLRGGLFDTDAPTELAADQCVRADNVEFFYSALGERRGGTTPLSLSGSALDDEAAIVHLSEWFPNNDYTNSEIWGIGATVNTSFTIERRAGGTYFSVSPKDDILTAAPDIYNITSVELNGKKFFAYPSDEDRLHVWDGMYLRRTGFVVPSAPTVADTGSGSFSTVRYYRVRWVEVDSDGAVLRRSEPSSNTTFTPSGSGLSARVTRPTLADEGETHWEVEEGLASTGNFYRIARVAIATTTYDDSLASGSVASTGVLSEDLGDYTNLPSARYLAVDGDRLVFAGHFTDQTKASQVGWTPVTNDPGVGNNERLPSDLDNTKNLDSYTGGPITGIAAAVYGTWYAFKHQRIYQMSRTNDPVDAYTAVTISTRMGAIPGSVFVGLDELGGPCIYFTDPFLGPARIGAAGIQQIVGLRKTWARVNLKAANIVARGCYYPFKRQAIWWVAVDGNDTPNLVLKNQVSELRAVGDGAVGGGWSLATGRLTEALCVSTLTEWVTVSGVATLSERPFIGQTTPEFIQRCDTSTTDNGTAFVATIITKPYSLAGLPDQWEARMTSVLGTAVSGQSVAISIIRDFGKEESTARTATFTPGGSETQIVFDLDNLAMSEAKVVQFRFTDG